MPVYVQLLCAIEEPNVAEASVSTPVGRMRVPICGGDGDWRPLRVAEALNQQGMLVTLDSLGESVSSEAEADRAANIYHQLMDGIDGKK